MTPTLYSRLPQSALAGKLLGIGEAGTPREFSTFFGLLVPGEEFPSLAIIGPCMWSIRLYSDESQQCQLSGQPVLAAAEPRNQVNRGEVNPSHLIQPGLGNTYQVSILILYNILDDQGLIIPPSGIEH